jgi:hypothetical protein
LAVLLATPVVLSLHRRSPEEVVTSGSVDGRGGLVIRPWRGHPLVIPVAWVVAAGVLALGLWYLGSSLYAAAVFIVAGLLLLYLVWARTTGRAGDGSLTLTPEGLHQLWAGSEVFIPWDDVRGLVTTPKEFIVETTRPVVPVHHMLPLLGRRKVVTEGAIALPHQGLPPLPYQEMIELYSTSSAARDELATDEPVRRARALLAAHPSFL